MALAVRCRLATADKTLSPAAGEPAIVSAVHCDASPVSQDEPEVMVPVAPRTPASPAAALYTLPPKVVPSKKAAEGVANSAPK